MKFKDYPEVFWALYNINRYEKEMNELNSVDSTKYKKKIEELTDRIKDLCSNTEDFSQVVEAFNSLTNKELNKHTAKEIFWDKYRKLKKKQQNTTSNEKEIRKKVKNFLNEKYTNCFIKDEFGQVNLTTRPDIIALHDNNFIAVEIKSDRDTIERLYRQIIGIQSFANIIYLAIDEKHLKNIKEKIHKTFPSVGLLIYSENELIEYESPYIYPPKNLFDLLWSSEVKSLLSIFKGRSKIDTVLHLSERGLREIVKTIYTQKEIEVLSRAIFFKRMNYNCQNNFSIEKYVPNIKQRQSLFDILLDKSIWNITEEIIDYQLYLNKLTISKKEYTNEQTI